MTMGTWKTRVIAKKNRGSQTPGKKKGMVATKMAKFMCRRNRSYKDRDYPLWCAKYTGEKVRVK